MPAYCRSKNNAAEVLAVAAVVYDQDSHSEADMAFLAAIDAANKEWTSTLVSAKRDWNGDVVVWEAIRDLATRHRNAAYTKALADFEAHDFADGELLQTAE